MKYTLGAALAALILVGCGEDEVGLVKNYTLSDFKSMSIGAAIEGSKICKNITWSKEENGGLKTVKMGCDVDMEKGKVDVCLLYPFVADDIKSQVGHGWQCI